MAKLKPTEISYLAGFLDGDGSVNFQIVRRKDYRLGFQIRASIVFYQKSSKRYFLEFLRKKLGEIGYVRDRPDEMTEFAIVGVKPVSEMLKLLRPYVVLKKEHVEVGLQICSLIEKGCRKSDQLLDICKMVDEFKLLNYSKRRLNTFSVVQKYLKEHELYPRND